ncbi:MAG: glycosyltransferase family 4 protein [Desulfomonilaceae bacterium]
MKIAAYLDQELHLGGGFQHSLNAMIQMERVCAGLYDFAIYTPVKANVEILKSLNLKAVYYSQTVSDKVLSYISWSGISGLFQKRIQFLPSLEKRLIRDGVDLVYFVSPSSAALSLQLLNYIWTLWDVCHRDFPEFPEVRSFGELDRREHLYETTLKRAFSVITNCEELKNKIIKNYSVDGERIVVVPLEPSIQCKIDQEKTFDYKTLQHYDLQPGYLFYPSQFWSHKNHPRLLTSLVMFRERHGYCPLCVFSGSQKGNLEVVTSLVRQFHLEDVVRFLGFVPSEHMPALYRSSGALVMTSYFGPVNMPPLEAMSLGIPIIYPIHLKEQCGDAAIYFDADDEVSLCNAIEKVLLGDERNKLLDAGKKKISELKDDVMKAEIELRNLLDRFQKRLECWKGQ